MTTHIVIDIQPARALNVPHLVKRLPSFSSSDSEAPLCAVLAARDPRLASSIDEDFGLRALLPSAKGSGLGRRRGVDKGQEEVGKAVHVEIARSELDWDVGIV